MVTLHPGSKTLTMHSITSFLIELTTLKSGDISLTQGFFALCAAYFGGILASLTPCVYPMIPITVSVVTGLGPTRKSWREVILRGTAYVSGMTLVYSFLGVIAGVSGRVFGSFTNTQGWYLSLGIIMSLASLIMLEVIPFDPIIWWDSFKRVVLRKSTHHTPSETALQKKEMTLLGACLLGASSGFIAAPCTTPILTSILAYIAKTQSVGLGFLLMASFSMGLGTLLLLICGFSGALQILPRSGQWMKTIKIGGGLILLAFAEYLIYRAGQIGGHFGL